MHPVPRTRSCTPPPASTTAPITDMISMNTFSLFSNHFLTTPGPVEVAIHNESP